MKSIKSGRGPSMMSGISCIGGAIFGVVWTILASSMGVGFMAFFGVIFIAFAIAGAIYNFKNATSENRYSVYDITDGEEEPDLLNLKYGRQNNSTKNHTFASGENKFCPYCGNEVKGDFEFCNKCGKKLP